jgi:RING-variant domain
VTTPNVVYFDQLFHTRCRGSQVNIMSAYNDMPGSWSWPTDMPDTLHQRRTRPSEPTYSQSSSPPRPEQPQQARPRATRTWGPRTCRICLDTVLPTFHPPSEHIPGILQPEPRVSYDSEGGKLISPCKCKGSQKYVHEQCLEAWRMSDPSFRARTYWECPTCKFRYKFSRLSWGRMIGSVGMYLVLEDMQN